MILVPAKWKRIGSAEWQMRVGSVAAARVWLDTGKWCSWHTFEAHPSAADELERAGAQEKNDAKG